MLYPFSHSRISTRIIMQTSKKIKTEYLVFLSAGQPHEQNRYTAVKSIKSSGLVFFGCWPASTNRIATQTSTNSNYGFYFFRVVASSNEQNRHPPVKNTKNCVFSVLACWPATTNRIATSRAFLKLLSSVSGAPWES